MKLNAKSAFSKWLLDQGKAEGTINTYLEVVNKLQLWLENHGLSFDDLNEEQIQSYISFLEKDKSPSTVEKHFAALSVFSKFLGNPKIMANIVRKVKDQKFETPSGLDLTEQTILLKEVEMDGNLRNVAMMYLLLHTGIRVSELCNLNITDIELNENKSKIFIRNNNNGEIERVIPLSKEAKKHVCSYLSTLDKLDCKVPLFTSSNKRRITTRAVQYILKKYEVNPHKLRHTFCYRLINNGVDLGTVSKLAGHKDINITKRYLKDVELNLSEAIDKTFS
ncbi:tyrosine-type recombinase/integrase [Neobacillus sp. D3-1R]|uniref:tyrosine-type recombinase/integrase n=1 Tax=Neobacillus sp. D3-1R TaxID=3445778 RepID=UPI003F9F4745